MESKKNDEQKIDRGIADFCVSAVIKCVLWLFCGGFCLLIFCFGGYDFLFVPFLGENAALILFGMGFVCALAPLYLIFIKNKRTRLLTAHLVMAAFIFFAIAFSIAAAAYFKDFTKEKWLAYPELRKWMLTDLQKNHGIIGMGEEDVLELLGTPDNKSDIIFAYYMAREGRISLFIEVVFDDGTVVAVRYINNL